MANTETYKGIYAMHKYWGKKPFNEISRFIEQYTEEGDTVLDSFCGSGITLIEALKANRKCIGIDLNPIAIKLAKVSLTVVDVNKLLCVFNSIRDKLKAEIYRLYEVDENGEKTIVTHTIWKNSQPVEVWYATSKERKKVRAGRQIDITMATQPFLKPKWYPTCKMYENSRINVGQSQTVADLFTPRALVGLSLILDEINQIQDQNIRDVLLLTFTGALSQASKLVFVIRRRNHKEDKSPRAEVGSWVIGYWVPVEHFEINVWNCFENRFNRVLKGESEIASLFSSRPDNYLESSVKLINGTATDLPLANESVDYVFIDPPHVNRVLYLEQSLMWNAWLRMDDEIKWDQEIVVSEAKERKDKDSQNYHLLLNLAFKEIRRVLKYKKYFSLAFNCLDDQTWLEILNLFIAYGFELSSVVPLEYSATSVVQDNRRNALKTDFVLTFRNERSTGLRSVIINQDEDVLKDKITKLIQQRPDQEVYNIMNALFSETIPEGYIFKVTSIVKICDELMK